MDISSVNNNPQGMTDSYYGVQHLNNALAQQAQIMDVGSPNAYNANGDYDPSALNQ